MTIPSISDPPAWPSITDPTNFDSEAEDFVQWWHDDFNPEINATITAMNTLGATLTSYAAGGAFSWPYTVLGTTTDVDPGAGNMKFDNFAAQTSATTLRLDLSSSDGVDRTNELTYATASDSATKGRLKMILTSDPTKWLTADYTAMATPAGYRNITITNVVGSAAAPFIATNSVLIFFQPNGARGSAGVNGTTPYEERATYATQLVAADGAKKIKYTGTGNATLSFDTNANLGAGWQAEIENGTTGYLQVTTDGSTYKMYPSEVRNIFVDNVNARLNSRVRKSFILTDTAAGTFLAPPGYYAWDYLGVGSGSGAPSGGSGASGKMNSVGNGASGGSGGSSGRYGCAVQRLIPVSMLPAGTSVSYAPGAAANGGAAATGGVGVTNTAGNNGNNGNVGSDGNATTFGSSTDPYYSTAPGGLKAVGGSTGLGQGGNSIGNAASASSDTGGSTTAAALATPAGYISTGNAVGTNSAASLATGTTSGSDGTAGAASNPSPFNPTSMSGGTPGVKSTAQSSNATAGSAPSQAAAGAGGAGGGGGGGSFGGLAAGNSGNGGNSGVGGQSGPGFVKISGRF